VGANAAEYDESEKEEVKRKESRAMRTSSPYLSEQFGR
jgi:hypothetical protein